MAPPKPEKPRTSPDMRRDRQRRDKAAVGEDGGEGRAVWKFDHNAGPAGSL